MPVVMELAPVFCALIVAHLAGDFLLQTEWQALHKRHGLRRRADPEARRALVSHVSSYTLAFVPVLVWIGAEGHAAWTPLIGVGIALPHLLQDDGRLLDLWVRRVKRTEPSPGMLLVAIDQSWHFLVLFVTAIVIAAL